MDIDTVADELYGLAPEEFIAARTAREKQARGDGDRELAAQIRQLIKPNTVAGLANQLVRRHREEIEPLLELGAGLREATATLSGDQLRTLGRQRHQLIYALVQLARGLAAESGRKISDDTARGLESTLNAALADEGAAAQLLAGRLTESLERSGFTPAVDVAPPPPARSREPKVTSLAEHRAAHLEQAERDVQRAQADLDEAQAARDRDQDVAEQAERDAEQAQEQVESLRAELDEAIAAQTQADEARRSARSVAQRSLRLAEQAQRRFDDASARRSKLS